MEINAGITLNKKDLNDILLEYFTNKGYITKGEIDIPTGYLINGEIQIGLSIDVKPNTWKSSGPIMG